MKVDPEIHDHDPGFAIIEKEMKILARKIVQLESEKESLLRENEKLSILNEDLKIKLETINDDRLEFSLSSLLRKYTRRIRDIRNKLNADRYRDQYSNDDEDDE